MRVKPVNQSHKGKEQKMSHEGLVVKIYPDVDPQSPADWDGDNELGIVTTHNRYFDLQQGGFTPDELDPHEPTNKPTLRRYWVFPLYMYAHSGVALSLGRDTYPFTDPWDSGQVGFVYVLKTSYKRREKARKAAQTYIKTWNQYLSGEVYGYVIETPDGNHEDSCWGFYGLDYCRQQAREAAEYRAEEITKAERLMQS